MDSKNDLSNYTLQKRAFDCRGLFDGAAIECEGRKVSYRELDRISDILAVRLIKNGFGPGKTIAVRMKRTEKFLFAMIAVIKTGAAFVPILSNESPFRVKEFEVRGNVNLTIDDAAYEVISRDAFLFDNNSDLEKEVTWASPEDAAIIIFTAGPMGIPKCICHTQKAEAMNSLMYPFMLREQGIVKNEIKTVIGKANQTLICAYMFEFFTALFNGHKLVFLTETEQDSSSIISKSISENDSSSLFITPTQAEMYLEDPLFTESMDKLSILILAGELLKDSVREKLLKHVSDGTQIFDVYGTTETHFITVNDIIKSHEKGGAKPEGVYVRIIDNDGKLLPPFMRGQIVVKTPFMSDQYKNRNGRFIDIFGRRCFMTGDEGYMTEAGRVVVERRFSLSCQKE